MDAAVTRTKTTARAPETNRPSRAAQRKRARWVTRAGWIVLALVAIAALVLAFRPKPVPVDVARVARGDLVVTVDELARTRVRDRYTIAAPLAGDLVRVELQPGDHVDKGAVVARIVPMAPPLLDPRARLEAQARLSGARASERQAAAAVARAELAAKHADDQLDRTRRLVESGSLPREQLTDAELEARMRHEELTSARFAQQMAAHDAEMAAAALRRFDGSAGPPEGFDVPSPVAGVVLKVTQKSAAPVQAGAPLVEIGDPAQLEIVADLLTADAVETKPGAPVTIVRWGGPPLPGHVKLVEPSAFTRISALGVEEQRVPVIVDLDAPREAWAALGDGYRVEVRIVVVHEKDALQVPLGAAFRHGDGWAVYRVIDGRARLAPVELGPRNDERVAVTRGLAEGDAVVVHPSERVGDGAKVAAR